MKVSHCALLLVLALLCTPPWSLAADAPQDNADTGVLVFSGVFTKDTMGDSANPVTTEFDRGGILGIALQRDALALPYGFAGGWEVGGAGRCVDLCSAEVWGGVYLRQKGLEIFPGILLKPSLTLGLSAVNRSIGMERERESAKEGRDARLLFYIGPELAFSLARFPRWELVYRLHHRSGGHETLGKMMEGNNANVLGVRYWF